MNDLKIRVSLGSFNVELEGTSEDVISQFNELKTNGLGQMVDQLVPLFVQNKVQTMDPLNKETVEEKALLPESSNSSLIAETTTLQDVVFKMLPRSESEWILVYGHFICVADKRTFTRDEIIGKYEESKRKDANTMKNLTASVRGAVKKGWISALNDKEFIVTPPGMEQIKEIFSRTEPTVKVPRKVNKKDTSKEK